MKRSEDKRRQERLKAIVCDLSSQEDSMFPSIRIEKSYCKGFWNGFGIKKCCRIEWPTNRWLLRDERERGERVQCDESFFRVRWLNHLLSVRCYITCRTRNKGFFGRKKDEEDGWLVGVNEGNISSHSLFYYYHHRHPPPPKARMMMSEKVFGGEWECNEH